MKYHGSFKKWEWKRDGASGGNVALCAGKPETRLSGSGDVRAKIHTPGHGVTVQDRWF